MMCALDLFMQKLQQVDHLCMEHNKVLAQMSVNANNFLKLILFQANFSFGLPFHYISLQILNNSSNNSYILVNSCDDSSLGRYSLVFSKCPVSFRRITPYSIDIWYVCILKFIGISLCLFLLFSHNQFHHKLMCSNVRPVACTGIKTQLTTSEHLP